MRKEDRIICFKRTNSFKKMSLSFFIYKYSGLGYSDYIEL